MDSLYPVMELPAGFILCLYEDLANSTALATGRKVKIKASSKGKGNITLSFKDESDLRDLLPG